MRTVHDLQSYAQQLAGPFAEGQFCADWEERSVAISAVSDYLLLKLRDDAFVSDEAASRDASCQADSGFRRSAEAAMVAMTTLPPHRPLPLSLPVATDDLLVLRDICGNLDFSEKIVMSTTALALRDLSMCTELFSVIANILFEEAYHLKIVGSLLGLDHSTRAWLSPDKHTNWELVQCCDTAYAYMLIEHALFEGRGGIAAARGAYTARQRGVSAATSDWLEKICRQETSHGILGFLWLDRLRLQPGMDPTCLPLIRRFIEEECDDQSGDFRMVRQRYSAWLLERYLGGAPIAEVVASLKANTLECIATGEILVSIDELSRGVDQLHARCR